MNNSLFVIYSDRPQYLHSQSGAALLLFLLILLVGSSAYFVSQINKTLLYDPDPVETYRVLQEAKQALITYAIINPDITSTASRKGRYGLLPCPDTNGSNEEGNQIGSCSATSINAIGRFPWQSLNIAPARDDSGECLWYAVSGSFKNNPNTSMLNGDTIFTEDMGSFEIVDRNGQTLAGGSAAGEKRVVAVIIAPGKLIQDQDRTADPLSTNCGGNYDPTNYLDNDAGQGVDNASVAAIVNALDVFMTTNDLDDHEFNDMVTYITAEEIFDVIAKREDKLHDYQTASNLTRLVAECLVEYAFARFADSGNVDYVLPWPAPIDLSDYTDSTEYSDYNYTSGTSNKILSGRVPIYIDNSNSQIGLSSPNDNLIEDCTVVTGDDKTELENLWENWKDHLFYAIAEPFQPGDAGTVCGDSIRCITINNDFSGGSTRDYAAVVMFSNSKLATQSRLTAPTDEKADITNYIENITATNNTDPYIDGVGDSTKRYDYDGTSSATLNDIFYCINDNDGSYDFDVCRCPTDVSGTFNGAADCNLP